MRMTVKQGSLRMKMIQRQLMTYRHLRIHILQGPVHNVRVIKMQKKLKQ